MYIAYSALCTKTKTGKPAIADYELQQRLIAYQAACYKYKQEIIAIQKYLPGWMPAFEAKVKSDKPLRKCQARRHSVLLTRVIN